MVVVHTGVLGQGNRDDLLEVKGLGASKLEAYGDALLEILAGYSNVK